MFYLLLYRYEYIELGATQKTDGGIFEGSLYYLLISIIASYRNFFEMDI